MIPIEVTSYSGFSSYSGSSNVPINTSVIISFRRPEKLESPEQPEKPCHESNHRRFHLTALPFNVRSHVYIKWYKIILYSISLFFFYCYKEIGILVTGDWWLVTGSRSALRAEREPSEPSEPFILTNVTHSSKKKETMKNDFSFFIVSFLLSNIILGVGSLSYWPV